MNATTRSLSSIKQISENGTGSVSEKDWRADLLRDLEFRYDGCPPDSQIMVSLLGGGGPRTHPYKIDQLDRIADDFAGQVTPYGIYARLSVLKQGTNLRPNARGEKEHTYGAAMIYTDIDPDGTDDFRERKLEELREFSPAPSVIVDSGRGYYAGWKIPWTTDWQRLERITKWLTHQLGSGADTGVWDAAHVYRLAGTWNPKDEAQAFSRIVEMHPQRCYTLDDFEEADFTDEEETVLREDYEEEALPLDFEAKVRATSEKLWARIHSEEAASEVGAPTTSKGGMLRVDRSRNDFYIAGSLLEAGLTHGQIMTVLTHPAWFSGSKFRETHSVTYVKLTIANAAKLSRGVRLRKASEIGDHLLEEMVLLNRLTYWYRYNKARGVYEECEDELLLRIQALAGPHWSGNLELNVLKYMRPHVREDAPPQTDLINVRNGMLHWRTGQLIKHSPKYRSITQINASWHADGAVDCAEVDAFVGNVLEEGALPVWWGFNGICLDSRVPQPYRCILGLVGRRKTGKSTLLKAIAMFVGEDNTSSVTLDALTGGGNQFTTSALVGSVVNLDMDSPSDVRIKENHTLKAISGGDKTSIERKHHGEFKGVYLTVKFAFGMNRVPTFGAVDEAFYDRWRVLQVRKGQQPFERKDGVMKINAHIRLLSQEKNRDAWLRRSIEGLQQIERNEGFPGRENATVDAGLREMRIQGDSVYRFVEECTEEVPGHSTNLEFVHQIYRGRVQAEGNMPLGRVKFRASLQEVAEEDHFPSLRVHHDGHKWAVLGRRLIPELV